MSNHNTNNWQIVCGLFITIILLLNYYIRTPKSLVFLPYFLYAPRFFPFLYIVTSLLIYPDDIQG